MTQPRMSEMPTHRRHGAGIMSRYAPHLWLWLILLAIGLFLGILGIAKPNAGTLLPGVLFVVGSFAPLIPLAIALARGARWARITPEGIEWQDGRGEHRWNWADIAAVYRLDKVINQAFRVKQLRVVPVHGDVVTFDQCLSDYERLADTVQTAVAQRLLPVKRAELAGSGAAFGPVTLSRESITINRKTFAWPEVEQYIVFRGSLVVYPTSYKGIQCEEVSLSDVPNYPVLLHLLQEQGRLPVPPERSILFLGRK
jgi:hypothetical protein